MRKKFLRRVWNRYSKLGKGRKKKQVWKRPTGRDNKMRERRRGYPSRVEIGYKNDNQKQILINNLKELEMIPKEGIIVLGKIGKKKKIEIAKKAKEKKIKFSNFNSDLYLKNIKKEEDAKKKKVEKKTAEKKKDAKKSDSKTKEKPVEKEK